MVGSHCISQNKYRSIVKGVSHVQGGSSFAKCHYFHFTHQPFVLSLLSLHLCSCPIPLVRWNCRYLSLCTFTTPELPGRRTTLQMPFTRLHITIGRGLINLPFILKPSQFRSPADHPGFPPSGLTLYISSMTSNHSGHAATSNSPNPRR